VDCYFSDESGQFEVYAPAFPDKGVRWQVSGAGGTTPMFSKNVRELFFRALDDRIMVADYSVKGDALFAEKPRAWSETRLPQIGILRGQFDVAPDGKRVAALTIERVRSRLRATLFSSKTSSTNCGGRCR